MPTGQPSGPSLLWEQHCCLPLLPDAQVGQLGRYARPGGAFVSVNVGYAPHTAAQVRDLLNTWAPRVAADPTLSLAATMEDVDQAAAGGRVAVAFDLEDCAPLEGRLERVQEFHDLGVRTLLPVYNTRNATGGGCLDEIDEGLTGYGRDLVAELNRVGITVDGSHCGPRTGLELSAATTAPMIYSHSCLRAVWEHPRNITDEQAQACAATGGVVGITGVGIFLGANDTSLDPLIRHIDYAVDLLGPKHVGVSTDYPFDTDDFNQEMTNNPHLFPDSYTQWGPIAFLPPEGLLQVDAALRARGYPEPAITAILGGNFHRIAQQTWHPAERA